MSELLIVVIVLLILALGYLLSQDKQEQREIEQRQAQRGSEAEEDAIALLKSLGVPYLHEVYCQDHQRHDSAEIDLIAPINGEVWLIEVKGWSGQLEGKRSDQRLYSKTRSRQKERNNPFHQLAHQRRALFKAMRARKVDVKVPLRSVLLLTHGSAHLQGLKEDEGAFSLKQLKTYIKTRGVCALEPQQKVLWRALQKMSRELDLDQARAFHKRVTQERQRSKKKRAS